MEQPESNAVEVKGTFMGEPIDLTIRECHIGSDSATIDEDGVDTPKSVVDPTVDTESKSETETEHQVSGTSNEK